MDKNSSLAIKIVPLFAFIFASMPLHAQSGGGSNLVMYGLVVIGVIIILGVVMQVADNLMQIEAQKRNVQKTGVGLFPNAANLLKKKGLPVRLQGKEVHVLKHGHNIYLEGEAEGPVTDAKHVTRYAVQPPNWRGIAPIPKMHVACGDNVLAGQPIFFDKQNPEMEFVAPVSGEVIEINRGAKRAISEIVILADKEIQYLDLTAPNIEEASREDLVAYFLKSGAWTLIRKRPYDIFPSTTEIPANIFVSTFDSAPLAPDLNLVVAGREVEFQKGLEVLAKLTHGKVHLGLDGRDKAAPNPVFDDAADVEKHWFRGPHPSGNVGIQIHHIAPISAADTVWTLGIQEVITIGGLFLNGKFDATRVIAITGDPAEENVYLSTYAGANITELLEGNTVQPNTRFISGDVLSGLQKRSTGYVNMLDDQITLIEEGNEYEMLGWLVPQKARPSISKTYPNFLVPDLKFTADTNTHGEQRAFVMTGEYESLLPMDIFPQHLFKAILTSDFERMEGLGIYELNEEDVALCEFACTSKQPLQQILRQGLDLMREQG